MALDVSEHKFTDSQKIDIGLSTGKQNLVDLLNILRNNAGIDDASSRVSLKLWDSKEVERIKLD